MDAMTQEELEGWLENLRQGKLSSPEMYHAIHEFGRAGFEAARPDIERLLTSDDPELRYIALETLTRHFRLAEHYETAKQFLEHDPDVDCRMMGASALKGFKRNTHDRRTLGILARVVRNDKETPIVRKAAYAAMLGVRHYNMQEQLRYVTKRIDLEHEVDWAMVDSYLSD